MVPSAAPAVLILLQPFVQYLFSTPRPKCFAFGTVGVQRCCAPCPPRKKSKICPVCKPPSRFRTFVQYLFSTPRPKCFAFGTVGVQRRCAPCPPRKKVQNLSGVQAPPPASGLFSGVLNNYEIHKNARFRIFGPWSCSLFPSIVLPSAQVTDPCISSSTSVSFLLSIFSHL